MSFTTYRVYHVHLVADITVLADTPEKALADGKTAIKADFGTQNVTIAPEDVEVYTPPA